MDEEKGKSAGKHLSEEEMKKIRLFCEGYKRAEERLIRNQRRWKRLTEDRSKVLSGFENYLFEQDVQSLKEQIKEDEEHTGYFRWALSHLGEREKSVLKQLYMDGCTWDMVVSETGDSMSVGAIDKARKRGLQQMWSLISDEKRKMKKIP